MPTFHVHRTKTVLPLLTWLGIFLMPLLVTMLEGQSKPFSWYATNFFLTLSICLMYYLNYFVLVERYLVRQRVKQFVLANFLAASVLSAADYLMVGVWLLGVDDNAKENILMQSTIIFFLVLNVLFALVISLSVAIRMTASTYVSGIKLADARKTQAETELSNLKSQLNPHFLFNTLNNIYALIDIDTERSKESVHDLSHLLRYVIYDTSSITVPLSGELAFIREYVHIESIRLAEEAVCEIFKYLERAYRDGSDMEARAQMQIAAFKAGFAFSRVGVGNIHAIAHTLGGLYNTPHGLANSVILPIILRDYGPVVYKKLSHLSEILGIRLDGTEEEKANAFIQEVEAMNERMGIPKGFDFIRDEDIEQMITWAMREANPVYPVPQVYTREHFREVIERIRIHPADEEESA